MKKNRRMVSVPFLSDEVGGTFRGKPQGGGMFRTAIFVGADREP
jgi:hypothetical protein